ncbi:MAG TPA: DUF4199 domain-containing protein [Cyclobacteriaceae bacterium]|nr:DUF4199 domain-containing protein [Cyclobacteriaceae bacterium]
MRVPLRYGLIGGVLGFVLLVVLYYIDRHPFFIHPIFDSRVGLFGVFMFFILRELRDYHFGGVLFFWQGLFAGGVFVFTFGLFCALLLWIFALNVPHFVIQYIDLATNQLKGLADQMDKEVYEVKMASLPSTTAFDLAALYLVQCFGLGLFISIILSVILRRQPKAE